MNNLFEQDISEYNIFELSDWLKACWGAVKPVYGADNQIDTAAYFRLVNDFCNEWEEHSKRYPDVYNSKTYDLAALYLSQNQTEIYFKHKNGAKVDVTDYVQSCYRSQLYNINSRISDCAKSEVNNIKHINDIIERFLKFGYSVLQEEKNLLSSLYFSKLVIAVELPKDFDINILDNKDAYILVDADPKGKKTVSYAKKQVPDGLDTSGSTSSIIAAFLRNNNINKNTYYTYINGRSRTGRKSLGEHYSKQRIGKDFFVNLAFLLALSEKQAQKLMVNEGYSIKGGLWSDDRILCKAFKLHFPQEYANVLLVGEGYPSLNVGKD